MGDYLGKSHVGQVQNNYSTSTGQYPKPITLEWIFTDLTRKVGLLKVAALSPKY
jgi:hypothetical protein